MKASITTKNSLAVLDSLDDSMSSAICSVVRTAIVIGIDVYGIHKGYSGLLEGKNQSTDAQLELICALAI